MSAAEEKKERIICTEAPLAISEETSEVGAIIRHEKLQRWLAEKQDIEIYPQPEQKSANWTASIGDPGKKQGTRIWPWSSGLSPPDTRGARAARSGKSLGFQYTALWKEKGKKKAMQGGASLRRFHLACSAHRCTRNAGGPCAT